MDRNNKEKNKKKCANVSCGLEIHTGDDALILQRVVIGLLRPIPLEETPLFFHDDECLKEFFLQFHRREITRKNSVVIECRINNICVT